MILQDLAGLVRQFLTYAGNGNLEQLRKEVSKEITESAYEQDDKLSADSTVLLNKEQRSWNRTLNLKELLVFDEGYVIEYASPSIFGGAQITVQLTADFEIDDIAINE